MSRARSASFVVRVVEDRPGQLSGVIERVATGAKEPFRGPEAIGRVIAAMLRSERLLPRADMGHPARRRRDGSARGTRSE